MRASDAVRLLCAVAVAGMLAGCHAPPAAHVAEAHELGLLGQSPLIIGRDGGWSSLLWGRAVWAFGDSVVTVADADGSTFHSNSYSATGDLSAADGIGGLAEKLDGLGSPQLLVPPTADEAAFNAAHRGDSCATPPCGARYAAWPGAMVFDPVQGQALISYGLVYAEPGAFNFHGVGQSLALWSDFAATPTRPTGSACPDHPSALFCQDDPPWTGSIVVDGDFLYGFACEQSGLDFPCRLARAPLGRTTVRDEWRSWDGSEWSAARTRGPVLFGAASVLRVFWNRYVGAWMAVYSAVVSNDVMFRTAPSLTGPWSDRELLFTADHKADDGGWTYDGLVQPDYSEGDGKILYVTYSRPNGKGWFGSEIAVVRVELK